MENAKEKPVVELVIGCGKCGTSMKITIATMLCPNCKKYMFVKKV